MDFNFLLTISVCLMAGLLMTRVIKPFKFPAVTGYLIAGILVGPYVLGNLLELMGADGYIFQNTGDVEALGLVGDIALGFIAFSIGNEFRLTQLRQTGRQAVIIAVLEALAAAVVVDAVLIALHFAFSDVLTMPVAITLGAIATATAPAATLMVVKQYKAKGRLTDILLPVVALDDAVCIVVFAISFGIAQSLTATSVDLLNVIVGPMIEIFGSLLLGTVMGFLFSFVERFFHSNSKRMSLSITFVMLTVALSMLKFEIPGTTLEIKFSSLLVCMMLGTVFCNVCDFSPELMDKTDKWTAPLFILFFVLSGAELEFDVFADPTVIVIGVVYILMRMLGKYLGATFGAKISGCEPNTVKYLGVTLFPQAGVALGMSALAKKLFGAAEGELVRNIILFAVLVYELFGPMLTKIAPTKAGNIIPPAEPPLRKQGKVVHNLHR